MFFKIRHPLSVMLPITLHIMYVDILFSTYSGVYSVGANVVYASDVFIQQGYIILPPSIPGKN